MSIYIKWFLKNETVLHFSSTVFQDYGTIGIVEVLLVVGMALFRVREVSESLTGVAYFSVR
ncbi:MAG: hypothetical protein KAI57_01490 [Candidatus Pacebacteria bacterium]|nr:hypothetical protein [Candidatus Paceibacterota bacterium]